VNEVNNIRCVRGMRSDTFEAQQSIKKSNLFVAVSSADSAIDSSELLFVCADNERR
jgi:hypothetical protein